MVPLAIAISGWKVVAPAIVNLARPVADATFVEFANTVVDVVADAIVILVCCASSSAHAEGVVLVPVAIAKTWNHDVAPAFQDCAWSVAHPAFVEFPHAVVHVVADAIFIRVCCTSPAANT